MFNIEDEDKATGKRVSEWVNEKINEQILVCARTHTHKSLTWPGLSLSRLLFSNKYSFNLVRPYITRAVKPFIYKKQDI